MYLDSISSSRWDSHFHSYVLTIYIRFYWLWELVLFNSLVRRGYIREVSVQLVPKYFSRDCSTDSIACSERKKQDENNINTRQQLNTETRHFFLLATWKQGRSKNLSLPIHLAHHQFVAAAFAPLLFHCLADVAQLSLCWLCFCYCCWYAVAPAIATLPLLLSLLLSLRCRSAVSGTPVFRVF